MEILLFIVFCTVVSGVVLLISGVVEARSGMVICGLILIFTGLFITVVVSKSEIELTYPKESIEHSEDNQAQSVENLKKQYLKERLHAFKMGYKRGQIDCQNDSIVWRRTLTDDGEIIFQKN